jgi:hypothetical protein
MRFSHSKKRNYLRIKIWAKEISGRLGSERGGGRKMK